MPNPGDQAERRGSCLLGLICLEKGRLRGGGEAADSRWERKPSENDEQDRSQAVSALQTQSGHGVRRRRWRARERGTQGLLWRGEVQGSSLSQCKGQLQFHKRREAQSGPTGGSVSLAVMTHDPMQTIHRGHTGVLYRACRLSRTKAIHREHMHPAKGVWPTAGPCSAAVCTHGPACVRTAVSPCSAPIPAKGLGYAGWSYDWNLSKA